MAHSTQKRHANTRNITAKAPASVCDILIIGGGPAGMAAATSAKLSHPDSEIVILEKNEILGRKLRATGNGRCNITNTCADGYEEVIAFLFSLGIATKSKERGFVYPVSESAPDVAELLELRLEQLGIKVYKGATVSAVSVVPYCDKQDRPLDGASFNSGISFKTVFTIAGIDNDYRMESQALVIAAGGKSAPVYGATGDGFLLARSLGHSVTRTVPSLTPVECGNSELTGLSGVRVRAIAKLLKDGEQLYEENGEVQFTKYGLSGICIFNLSRMMRFGKGEGFDNFDISLDVTDGFNLSEWLTAAAKRAVVNRETVDARNSQRSAIEANSAVCENSSYNKLVEVFMTVYKEGLAMEIIRQAGLDYTSNASILTDADVRDKIIRSASDLRFKPTGLKGWKEAQCTSGGVDMHEIDDESFESKLLPKLYIVGETLDYDGFCGGYNLNHAFLSGKRAGEAAAREI